MEKQIVNKTFVKVSRGSGKDGEGERWAEESVCPTLNVFDNGSDTRAVVFILTKKRTQIAIAEHLGR